MKRILALDLGTHSIGWAVVERDGSEGRIVALGSRILPMGREQLRSFEAGMPLQSPAARRRRLRSDRRRGERRKQRRERLRRALEQMGWPWAWDGSRERDVAYTQPVEREAIASILLWFNNHRDQGRERLRAMLRKQAEYYPELRERITQLVDGIVFHKRPKKGRTAPACPYERAWPTPCIPFSHPLCQQFLGRSDTRLGLQRRLPKTPLSEEQVFQLWHLLYSVTDPDERRKALSKWGVAFVNAFVDFPAYEKEYGPCSAKAIKKLLPLMAQGMGRRQAVEQLYGPQRTTLADFRNPIVRRVVGEALRIADEIEARWGAVDAIHLELGEQLGSSRHARKRMAEGEPFAPNQARDTRTITRAVADLLAGKVGREHLVRCPAPMVARLRREWGLEEVWDALLAPRFERLNALTDSTDYGLWIEGRFHPRLPAGLREGFRKKRLDHRHHALDALVVACATEGIWEGFAEDARAALEGLVVSHKGDRRVLGKSRGRLSIRKPLHQDSIWGRVDDRTAAMRKPLDATFTAKKIARVCQPFIRKTLGEWLERHGGNPRAAFGAEGLERLDAHLAALGHPPIRRVRITEPLGQKFPLGSSGVKARQWVEAAPGTHLYFALYAGPAGRTYRTVPLREVIGRLTQGLPAVPPEMDGNPLLFSLSPGDLVYVPAADASEGFDPRRVYKMVSCFGRECRFMPHTLAWPIVRGVEFGSNNLSETAFDGQRIKAVCEKLEVDRLGNIM